MSPYLAKSVSEQFPEIYIARQQSQLSSRADRLIVDPYLGCRLARADRSVHSAAHGEKDS